MARNFLTRKARTGAFQDQRVKFLFGLRRFGSEAPVAEVLQHAVERVLYGGGAGSEGTRLRFDLAAMVEVDLGASKLVGRFQSVELDQDRFVAGVIADERDQKELLIRRGDKTLRFDPKRLAAGELLLQDGELRKLDELSPYSVISPADSLIILKKPAPVGYVYKARPLNGIWATAPYLHNGSIPNLDELLKPAADRSPKFHVGSREFDPTRVGFQTDKGFLFDTSLPGNSNQGHEYGTDDMKDDQKRAALLEYLKSL